MTISVIIPAYNHARELVDCLRALQKQTRRPNQVVIVDDGSTDEPERYVREAGLDRDIVWIRHEFSQGAPRARNHGFERAFGEAVLFLDADAVLREDALECLHQALLDNPEVAFAYSAFRFGGKVFRGRPFSLVALAEANYIHTSSLIRREWFPGFDPELKKFQDWDLWLRIAQQGGVGIYVPELLMTIRERTTGMSRWLPSFVYREPFRRLSWVRPLVDVYEARRQVIVEKHRVWRETMLAQPSNAKRLWWKHPGFWMGMGALFALLSVFAIGTPLNSIAAIGVALVMLAVSAIDPRLGLAWIALEVVVGSKGGFLKYGADPVNDGGIGIRILQFVGFGVGWLMWFARTKQWREASWRLWLRYLWPWLLMMMAVVYGVVRGVWLQQPFVVADANAWGFLLLAMPLGWMLMTEEKTSILGTISPAIRAGVVLLTTFTLVTFLFFAQVGEGWVRDAVYLWIRQSGLGEVTRAAGSVFRIFLQSQIYLVIAWLWVWSRAWRDHLPLSWKMWTAWVALSAAILASMSRSFWAGLVAAAMFMGLSALLYGHTWREWCRLVVRPAAAFVGGGLLLLVLAFLPITGDSSGFASAFGGRFAGGEAAASSRSQLLPVMREGIAKYPFAGSGFGATLTYPSSDPRIVQKTGGLYTTYAFEWGWLDLWYKMGLSGVVCMVILLGMIGRRAFALAEQDRLWVWASIIALATVHIFTPYLNHPLGIGCWLFLWAVTKAEKPPTHEESGA